jgi:excisionase family DNA binding protein
MIPVDSEFMTAAEVADRLRLSMPTTYRLLRAGILPSVRIGGSLRVPRRELDESLGTSYGERPKR